MNVSGTRRWPVWHRKQRGDDPACRQRLDAVVMASVGACLQGHGEQHREYWLVSLALASAIGTWNRFHASGSPWAQTSNPGRQRSLRRVRAA